MAWDDGLQPGSPAHQIAASQHRHIRVLAGPGTGKSFAMKRRVARILEVEQVSPGKVLAVTFTRVAAEDLHRELVTLGVNGAQLLQGRTLHSTAMRILMRSHVLAVLGRIPRPLNKFELEPLLEDLGSRHGDKHARRRLIKAYGAGWARLHTEEPGFTRTPAEQEFVDDLIAWLQFHGAMLMEEVIPYLYQYLKNNPGAAERTEFQHILIDEYQDLNRAEQDALRLMGDGGATCVIGDDDQSIYSFKHAHPDGIQQWPTLQPTDSHEIAECQRCPTTVVAMATALIAKNTGRAAKQPLQPIAAKGLGEVVIRQYSTVDMEADAVADKIARLIGSGVSPGEIIVLTQRATFAKPILERLLAKSIPIRSYYSETELDSAAAQERFAIFTLLLNNNDRVALRWLLGTGTSDWRRKPYRRIMHHVSQNGSSPWAVLSQIADGTLSLPHTRPLVERFRVIRAEIQSLAGIADLDPFIQAWLPSTPDTALLEVAVNVAKEGATTPQDLFDELYETITQPEIPNEVAEVRIMSLHKSKGLSSPYVFIVGCTEGLLSG